MSTKSSSKRQAYFCLTVTVITDHEPSVSDGHLRYSDDMIERLKNTDFTDKCLASFDGKSLLTNVPVDDALRVIKNVVGRIDSDQLPLAKSDYRILVSMCMEFGVFVFRVR